jgi:hypothetical protein
LPALILQAEQVLSEIVLGEGAGPSNAGSSRYRSCRAEGAMRRRDFIKALGSTLGGAAATWPLAARAQRVPVIGYLAAGNPVSEARLLSAFIKGLGETGYQDGKNAKIEFRWAENRYDQLPRMAAELAGREVAVIAARNVRFLPLADLPIASQVVCCQSGHRAGYFDFHRLTEPIGA